MKSTKSLVLFLTLVMWSGLSASSQPSISGPSCVVPGIKYLYLIRGNWNSTSTMQVCVSGATIVGTTGNCTSTGTPQSFVLVSWNNGIAGGSVTVNSSSGNATLNVRVCSSLVSGAIDSSTRRQTINYGGVPGIIRCASDSGGSCAPFYSHQWQQSLDGVNWTDVIGAIGKDLTLFFPLARTSFYRRKAVEIVSGSIAYSDIAVVYVGPPPPGTNLTSFSRPRQLIFYNVKS